jgi:hypothetical protein
VFRLFDEKQDNLAEARRFIASKLEEYDTADRWAKLDAVMRDVKADQLIDQLNTTAILFHRICPAHGTNARYAKHHCP